MLLSLMLPPLALRSLLPSQIDILGEKEIVSVTVSADLLTYTASKDAHWLLNYPVYVLIYVCLKILRTYSFGLLFRD